MMTIIIIIHILGRYAVSTRLPLHIGVTEEQLPLLITKEHIS